MTPDTAGHPSGLDPGAALPGPGAAGDPGSAPSGDGPPRRAGVAAPAGHADDAPGPIERAHLWVVRHWPATLRVRVAVILAVVALGLVAIATTARLVHVAISLDLLAYVGLMVFCWVGAGGALVPIRGSGSSAGSWS